MDYIPIKDISIILAFSILILLMCYRFKIPEIIGFLLTGILVGPYGFGIFTNTSEIEFLAEIGVVLLLFTIGIEFSFKRLLDLKKQFFVGGVLQVTLTFIAAFIISNTIGLSLNSAILIGFLLALSSTAIVLRLLQERDEMDSPHGRIILGVLIFQDIIAVPMMMVIPFLTGNPGSFVQSVPLLILEAAGVILLVIIGTIWIVPRVLYRVARTRSNELFMLCIVVICLAMAWLTSSIGLSLALGAFLAGLIISESQYSYQALGSILPFRYVFTSFFFISIGMLLDVGFFMSHPALIIMAAIAFILIKAIMAGATTLLMGYPVRTAVLTGLALSQVGEFSFILSQIGLDSGLLTADLYQLFLVTSIVTMAATPFLIASSHKVSDIVCRFAISDKIKYRPATDETVNGTTIKDHLVIIGYGLNGKNIAKAAKASSIPYRIIEMNPDTVIYERSKGEPIYYGDATNNEVLMHAGITEARIIVIAISDAMATRRIIKSIRQLNPKAHILVRTRYLKEMKLLYELGANEVIPEEFETSVEIFARVLKKYLVPKETIDQLTMELRSENYEIFRKMSKGYSRDDLNVPLSNVEITTVQIGERSPIAGKTICDIGLRKKYEVTILFIKRNSNVIYNPSADTQLLPGDIIFVFGTPQKLSEVVKLFNDNKGNLSTSEPVKDASNKNAQHHYS